MTMWVETGRVHGGLEVLLSVTPRAWRLMYIHCRGFVHLTSELLINSSKHRKNGRREPTIPKHQTTKGLRGQSRGSRCGQRPVGTAAPPPGETARGRIQKIEEPVPRTACCIAAQVKGLTIKLNVMDASNV